MRGRLRNEPGERERLYGKKLRSLEASFGSKVSKRGGGEGKEKEEIPGPYRRGRGD